MKEITQAPMSTLKKPVQSTDAAACQWIAVSERLPAIGETVLGFWANIANEPVTSQNYGIAKYEGDWRNPDHEDEFFADPEYWMPLPEPPK